MTTVISPHTIEGEPLAQALPNVTLPQLIRERARRHPDDIALVDAASGRSTTYGELDRLVGRCAAGLAAQGFKPGDVLVIFAPNSIDWPIAALGAMAAGGVVSGANPMYLAGDLAHQIRNSGARFALTIPPLLATVREAAAQAGCENILVFGEAEGCVSFATLLACDDAEPDVTQNPDALAALPCSSGTTGLPKGVMLAHRNLIANITQFEQGIPTPHGSVVLAFLPMFHIFGFTLITLAGLVAGVKLVTVPRFEPEPFLKAIASYRVSRMAVVPPVMQFLAGHPMVDNYDLTSLRLLFCGAAPMGSALEEKVSQRLNCPVVQGYGMTESSCFVTGTAPERKRSGSCGLLAPRTQGRVVSPETGADMPRGEQGEIWFRGPQQFIGYLNQPEATAETITPDGWVRTGDIGYFDADGYLFITDRLKELIKVKGFQVAPAELEALLLTHPSVADVAVISRPDERAGEVPVAYVVPRGELDAPLLKAWLAERVVDFKQLADVVACDAIPKNPSGKILRRVLRGQDSVRVAG